MFFRRDIIRASALALSIITLATGAACAGSASGKQSVWRDDCGPYGHRGPSGGCIPGGRYGAGSYYFLGPDYYSSRDFAGPPNYGAPPAENEPDYGVGYWGTRPYNIPAFQ